MMMPFGERTDHLYALVKDFITPMEWPNIAPLVDRINQLKLEKDAVILAHNYMTPDVYSLVGDFRGDSLQLAREAAETDQKVIVQAGVHFMAETSKILAPDKTVLIPDTEAGCSLAASITGEDVKLIKQKVSGRAHRHLCQHDRRCEGRVRHHLHLLERRSGCRACGQGMGH